MISNSDSHNKRLAMEMTANVTTANETRSRMAENVLVYYDGSAPSRWAVLWAVTQAERHRAKLTVIVVIDQAALADSPPSQMVTRWEAARSRGERQALAATSAAKAVAPAVEVEAVAEVGAPAALLVSGSRRAGLVVLGLGPTGVAPSRRPRLVVEAVVASARCPVVVIGQQAAAHAGPDHPVVVGIDGSRRALHALDFAAASAAAAGAPLHVVSVWSAAAAVSFDTAVNAEGAPARAERAGPGHSAAASALARAHARFPQLRTNYDVVAGYPPAVLIRAARGAGLVVLGRRGLSAAPSSVDSGSVSRSVMRAAPCPVAVIGTLGHPQDAPEPESARVLVAAVDPDVA
jgi:nucleotide-binding universal stress UspA family protein